MSAPSYSLAKESVGALTRRFPSIVLAVSGGLDSTCLLHLARACAGPGSRLRVATFDHCTGPHSTHAVDHVVELARQYGLPVHVGRARTRAHSESAWRAMRWQFLQQVAVRHRAIVATAHTRDDHLETVVMRILRGAGARGLAGLLAESPGIVRPLVHVTRAALTNYAKHHDLTWIDDPTNASLRFFRNRVRLDLLPALRRADPSFPRTLLRLSERAAELRRQMELVASSWVSREGNAIVVSNDPLALPDRQTRAAVWPALAGPHHLVLDQRGIARLSALDVATPQGTRVPLSGRWEATRVTGGVRLRRMTSHAVAGRPLRLPALGRVEFGGWSFEVLPAARDGTPDDAWSAWIPEGGLVWVRPWKDGDRLVTARQGAPRRVKRFFADQRIPANERKGWPVVIANGEIIWIPGIRRATAVSARSGRPARLVVCERIHV